MSASAAISRTLLALAALTLLTGCAGNKIALLNPETAQSLGKQEYQQQHYAEAAGYFNNAINKDPRDYLSFYYLGVCYDQMRDYEKAIQSYNAGLKVQPLTYEGKDDHETFLKLMDGLGIAIAKSSERNAEIVSLEALAAKSQSAWDYFLLGKISRYSGDADKAVENYSHAVLLEKRNFTLLKEYGLYLQQLNQVEQARSILVRANVLDLDDQQVAAALRILGVVPGPSLKEKSDLAQPVLLPRGPIPTITDITKSVSKTVGLGGSSAPQTTTPPGGGARSAGASLPPATPALQAPRD
jgi:tetratricopeptide (TPR) repeat protein